MPSPILVLNSQTHYVADGSTTTWNFNFAGGYISKDHVKAYKIEPGTELIVPIPLLEADIGEAQVSIIPAITDGASVVIYRDTPKDMPLVDYTNGQGYDEASLDTTAKQAVFIAAEVLDRAGQALNVGGGVAELQELLLGGSGAGLVGYFNAAVYPANTVGSGIKSARTVALAAEATAEEALAAVDDAVALKANRAGDTFTGTVTVPELRLDSTASLGVSGGSVNVLFDTGDGLVYNRGTNTLDVNLGGSRMTVSAAAGPERSSDASTDNGIPRKSQMDAAIAAGIDAAIAGMGGGTAGGQLPGAFSNLKLSATGTGPWVDLTADAVVLHDPVANTYVTGRNLSISAAVNITGTTSNGIAVGGAAVANSWYAVWVRWNGSGFLLSLTLDGALPPAGTYTHYARVGWIRTDGTGNKYPLSFRQWGRAVQYSPVGNLSSGLPQGSLGVATGSVSLVNFVPPTAAAVRLGVASAGSTNCAIHVGSTTTVANGPGVLASIVDGSPAGTTTTLPVTLGIMNPPSLRSFYIDAQASTATYIQGWEDNL